MTEAPNVSASWRVLLPLRPGATILEVSGDGGARARGLGAAGMAVMCLRHDPAAAGPVRAAGFEALTLDDPPGALVADAAVVALGRHPVDLPALTGWLGGSLKPGAAVVVSVANRWLEAPGVRELVAHARNRPRADGEPAWPGAGRGCAPVPVAAALTEAGFDDVRTFAPLPAADKPKFLVPLDEPQIVEYFFANLVPRPRALHRRLAVAAARRFAVRGWFAQIAPAYEIVARAPGTPV